MNKKDLRNRNCKQNEIAKHYWEADHNFNWNQKKAVDEENRLSPWGGGGGERNYTFFEES